MTGSAPVSADEALRAALSHMQIEEPGTGRRFEAVLAERNGWPLPLAERIADEYRGFLYLAATAGFEVTPSEAVDQAWHLHLEWPHYRDVLCERILGRPLEHRPGTGSPDDELRYRRQYEETLALYERIFDKGPPRDIWPRPSAFDEEERAAAMRRTGGRKLAVAGAVTVAAAAAATRTPTLVDLFMAMIVAGMILPLLVMPSLRPRPGRNYAGCGGACGVDSGGDNDGGGCGASCGGGCGGD